MPHRNDVTVGTTLCPDENHHATFKPSGSDPANLAIIKAVVEPSRMVTLEHRRGVRAFLCSTKSQTDVLVLFDSIIAMLIDLGFLAAEALPEKTKRNLREKRLSNAS